MIVFELACSSGHRFEGWFGSSDDFAYQHGAGLVVCPQCGSLDVSKAPMAPRLTRKGNQMAGTPASESSSLAPTSLAPSVAVPSAPSVVASPVPQTDRMSPEAQALFTALAHAQAEALKKSRWVGNSFADNARAMHYGERAVEAIHGQATPHDARALFDEGIDIAPVLFPLAAPGEIN